MAAATAGCHGSHHPPNQAMQRTAGAARWGSQPVGSECRLSGVPAAAELDRSAAEANSHVALAICPFAPDRVTFRDLRGCIRGVLRRIAFTRSNLI